MLPLPLPPRPRDYAHDTPPPAPLESHTLSHQTGWGSVGDRHTAGAAFCPAAAVPAFTSAHSNQARRTASSQSLLPIRPHGQSTRVSRGTAVGTAVKNAVCALPPPQVLSPAAHAGAPTQLDGDARRDESPNRAETRFSGSAPGAGANFARPPGPPRPGSHGGRPPPGAPPYPQSVRVYGVQRNDGSLHAIYCVERFHASRRARTILSR